MVTHTVSAGSIKTQFPEFASLSNAYIELFITNAEVFANPDAFCSLSQVNMAVSYMTAHLLKSTGEGSSAGASGPLTMEKVGDLQRQFANISKAGDWLSTTGYGVAYLALRKTIVRGPILVC